MTAEDFLNQYDPSNKKTVSQEPESSASSFLDQYDPSINKNLDQESSGVLRQAADIPLKFAQGGISSVKSFTDLFGADNAMSKELAGYEKWVGSLVSAESKKDDEEIARILKDAENKGVYDKVVAGLQAFSKAPLEMTAQSVGYMIPQLAAGVLGKAAQFTKAGIIGTQAAIGFAQGAGQAKGDIYESTLDYLRKQGLPENVANDKAIEAQATLGKNLDQILLSGGLNALASTTGAEAIATRILTKQGKEATGGAIKGFLKGVAAESPLEAIQSAQQEVAKNIGVQREGGDVPTFKGAIESATTGAVSGAFIGGPLGAFEAMSPEQKEEIEITKEANRKARDLEAPDTATQAIAVAITNLERGIDNKRKDLDVLEMTSPEAAKLRLDIAADQKILVQSKEQANKLGLSETITEAEKQQIELAKQIAAPEVAATAPTEVTPTVEESLPVEAVSETITPAIEARAGVTPQMDTDYLAAAAPVAIVPPKVENVSSIPTPEESKKWDDLSAYQKPIIESQETESLDLLASRVGVKRQGVSDIKLQEKIITNTHPDDIQDALVELKLSPPAPVTEQAAPAEAPAPEVAPVKPLTDDEAETIRDVITLRKSQGRELNPEQVKRLAEYDAKKAGVEVQAGDIVSNIVVGHPMFESPQPELNNLVPIKVTTKEQLASPIQRAQQVRDTAQSYIGSYQVEQAKAKTPAQKKAFAKKFTPSELARQRDILDYIKNDVMPELDRLEKLAPSATPAVSETIAKPALPKLQRGKADTDFASIDEITDIIQESSPKGTDKSESKKIAINFVKDSINESIDWVRDTFGSAPEKVGFDASQMKKWLQNAVSIRPVTEDEFTRGIIKKKGQLTKEGRDRGKIDVSIISPMESRMIALHEASHFLYHLDEDKQIPEKVLNSIKNKRLMPDKFPNPGKGIKERFADAFTNWAFTKMHPEYANEFPAVPQEFVSWIESEAINKPLDYISSVNKIRKQKQAKPKLGEKGVVLIPTKEDFIQAGQNIYEKGMEFGAWAKQMIQQFGDVVREFLGDVWQAVSGAPAKFNELMGYLPGKGEAGAVNIGKPTEITETAPAPIEPEAETITEAMGQGLDIGKEDNMPINNKIESHIKNFAFVRGIFESASDRLRRAKFTKLATAIDDYYDQAQRRLGFANKILLPAFEEYSKQSKANKAKIDEEVKMFFAAQENKRDTAEFFDELNPITQKIVTAWQKFGEESGKDNQRIGIKVFDRGLERFRPIGRVDKFFPRILKPEYKRALMEPDKYQKEYNEIVEALMKSGRIEKPEDAERYISNYEGTGTQKDYFSGIESARGQALPEELYDYSMQVMTDYVARWSQHASRIEQFGQKLGENSMTLWDRSRASTRDRRTIDYITAAQERVEGYFPNDPFVKGMAALNIWASGLQLGNPASATMNLVGGTTLNAMIGQPGAASSYVESLVELRRLGSNLQDAREKGIISRDLMNIVGDHQEVLDQNGIAKAGQKTADFLLKWSGFTPVEQMVRTQSLIIGKSFLRKTLSSYSQNPDSLFSKQASTWLSRNNFDIDKLIVEQGSGPETDKLMRYFATASQGGYTISQTPIFIDTPIGKFLFKYQKFSTQVMRQAWKNTFEPAWKAVTFKGETMQLPSETRQLLYRLRLAEAREIGDNRKISLDEIPQKVSKAEAKALTLIPVMMWLASAYVGGEAILRLRDVLFGVMMKGPDYEDILKALEDDEDDDELYLGLQRAWYNLIGIGALGLIGNYGQFFMDWQDRERVKNPLDPPALSLVKETATLIQNVADQGTLTKGDINNYVNRMSSMYRVSQKLYQTAASGLGFSDAPTVTEEIYRREVAEINKYGRRWAESAGLEYRTKRPMDIAPSKMTPINRKISSYLQRNDPVGASAYAKEYLKTLPKDARKNAIQSMESGARNRQPLRLGDGPMDEAEKRAFLKWAKTKMSPEKYAGIEKLAKQYESNRKKFLMRLPNR